MIHRPRILIVVTTVPARGLRLASSEAPGLPCRDAVLMASQLLGLGFEVRVLDQDGEHIPVRTIRREARWWRADAALLYAGGSRIAANPVPDVQALRTLVRGWQTDTKLVVVGPLADVYGEELVEGIPELFGALRGNLSPAWLEALDSGGIPGLIVRGDRGAHMPAPEAESVLAGLPAWHLLLTEAKRSGASWRSVGVVCGDGDLDQVLESVRHAVHRAGARFIHFQDRDLMADSDRAQRLAPKMFGAAPGVGWSCRVRADNITPMQALHLFQGGCREVLVTAPSGPDALGKLPMDDPDRPALEAAVEAVRITGMSVIVEHVLGRPGHNRDTLGAWQRWYLDRSVALRPHVRLLHAGDRGSGRPTLDEAREGAGCWDNALRPKDIERAVRLIQKRPRESSGAA